jgi:hypothetical protein
LEEQQSFFFELPVAVPVWHLSAIAFNSGRQDFSSSQGITELPASVLSTGRVSVRMTTEVALGGAQHAEPQAMVRDEEVQGIQAQN